jgi:hypothetical protein
MADASDRWVTSSQVIGSHHAEKKLKPNYTGISVCRESGKSVGRAVSAVKPAAISLLSEQDLDLKAADTAVIPLFKCAEHECQQNEANVRHVFSGPSNSLNQPHSRR